MKPGINAAMTDIEDSRESKSPLISHSGASTEGEISYLTYDDACVEPQFACAGRHPWYVNFIREGEGSGTDEVDWCELPAGTGSCWNVRRIALHEYGHVLALYHANSDNNGVDESIMQSVTPSAGQPGGSTHDFQNCDRARLQWLYGRLSSGDQLAGCHHEAAWAVDGGIPTQIGLQAHGDNVDFDVCTGDTVTFSGSLRIQNITSDDGDLGALANDRLAGRTVALQKRDTGSGSYVTAANAVTDSDGVWTISQTYQLVHDYEFRSAFWDGVGSLTVALNDDTSSAMRVRWLSC